MSSTNSLHISQKEAIKHLLEWKVGALFMEAGTGKTRVACELINAVDEIDKVIWFGPLRTIIAKVGSVKAEIEKWGLNAPVSYYGVESIGASDRIYMEAYNEVKNSKCPFVVVDESIKIKNYEAKRTKRLLEIGKISEYKLILNGTPITRNILDVWSQMQFLSPKILNMTMADYKNTFCNYKTIENRGMYRTYKKEIITGYANIDYLTSLISDYVYQCDLKLKIDRNYHEMRYEVDMDSIEQYHMLKAEMLSDEMLMFRNNNIFLEMTNKMQHAYCVTDDKFYCVRRILEEVDPEKTIIFTRYVKSAEECRKQFPDVTVLSYQKEALGLNLQQFNTTIYFDKIWDYALRNQSWHRTYRMGQSDDCEFWDLTTYDVGLDRLIDRNISKKITMTEYFKTVSRKQLEKDL